MNQWIGSGHLTSDPEINDYGTEEKSNKKARCSVAVQRRGAKEGKQDVDFIPLEAWDKVAEIMEKYARCGMKVTIRGEVRFDKVEEGDSTRYYPKILVNEIELPPKEKE